MARLLGDHGQCEDAKLAVIERPDAASAAAVSAAMMTAVMPPVTAIRRVIGLGETTV